MTKLIISLGTRPEASKLGPVINALRKEESIETAVVFTSQHRELARPLLDYFGITPDYDLDVMRPGQDSSDVTARVLEAIRDVYRKEKPDMVMVQGDTTSAFAAALAAFYQQIPVAHVEAGLRTDDRYNPFPEEMNRRLITHLASLHFAPTERNRQLLLREGVADESIHVTGNPGIDALMMIAADAARTNAPRAGTRTILLTAHRRESFGEPLGRIFTAVRRIVERHDDVEILYPVHPNPSVLEAVVKHLPDHPRIHLVEPLDYIPFVEAMSRAYLVMTDSGGVQEEAPALGVPVVVLREETEREELLDAGGGILAGTDTEKIVHAVEMLLNDSAAYERMSTPRFPFGDGRAAERIVAVVRKP